MLKKKWPCNPTCSLYYCMNETTVHLLTECNYTEATWNLVAARFNLPGYDFFGSSHGPLQWVHQLQTVGSKADKKRNLGILCAFWWMVWKERNRRIFEAKEISAHALAMLIREAVDVQDFACRSPDEDT
jgi:hypothetical protein